MVVALESVSNFTAEQLRDLTRDLITQIANQDKQLAERDQQISLRDQAIASKDR